MTLVVAGFRVVLAALRVESAAYQRARLVAGKEAQALARLRRRWVQGQIMANVLLSGWLLLLVQSWLAIDWPWPHLRWTLIPR